MKTRNPGATIRPNHMILKNCGIFLVRVWVDQHKSKLTRKNDVDPLRLPVERVFVFSDTDVKGFGLITESVPFHHFASIMENLLVFWYCLFPHS